MGQNYYPKPCILVICIVEYMDLIFMPKGHMDETLSYHKDYTICIVHGPNSHARMTHRQNPNIS